MQIGGIPQWISVRGSRPDNPLLVFLHGGPGSPMMGEPHAAVPMLPGHAFVAEFDRLGTVTLHVDGDRC